MASYADLKKKRDLEGAPDPFPSLHDPSPVKPRPSTSTEGELDTESYSAFPSLASLSPPGHVYAKPVWGSAAGPRIKPAVSRNAVFSDSFTIPVDLANAGRDGKPASLGEVIKQIMAKYKVKLEASANQKTRLTTFHMKGDSQKELDKAKRSLLALLSPVITLVINAPVSTIAAIIGPKGATLKQIREQTNVRVDIPRRDSLVPPGGNGNANGLHTPSSGSLKLDEEEEEPTVPVTLSGPQPLVHEAQALLNQIISSKLSKTTQRVRDIPPHILPFITARRAEFIAAADGADINLALNNREHDITVNGDREFVSRVVETIKATVEELNVNLTSVKISLPRHQHRLLVGKAVDEILAKSNCSVVVAKADDPGDEVTIWGQGTDVAAGLTAVFDIVQSRHVHVLLLPGPLAFDQQVLTYFARTAYIKALGNAHSNVSVHMPDHQTLESKRPVSIDIVGEKAAVEAVARQISEMIGRLDGAIREVEIDWLIHRFVTGKNAKRLKQLHETHNVQFLFPPDSDEQSSVLLFYDPLSSFTLSSPDGIKKHLDEATKEVLKMAKDVADIKSETIAAEKKWHGAVVGKNGTTLNAIIGEDKTLSIKVGGPLTPDVIFVRGVSSDVDRAVKEIQKILEDARNDEIDNSYSTEFDIDREFVGRIVGAQGSGINRLRDQLGVKVDVSDDVDDKEKEGGKKKKVVHQKSKVKITGRKENVEDAKKRILAQLERLADETSEVLKIPHQYHSSLIGQNGRYAIRLEERYSVKVTFPRHSAENGEGRTREQLKHDEVLIKGGKKGVALAKADLLEAVEVEKESNNVLKFNVPTRCVARILGKGGASINEIKDTTGAQIDVDKSMEDGNFTQITARGTKDAIVNAKAAILAISNQVNEETSVTIMIENKLHRSLIGAGGQGLKDLIARSGGPSETRSQAGLIRFPRQGDPSDEVHLRGEPKVVNKLKAELEKAVAALRDRVVLAVDIPAAQHRTIIGRGGQHLNDLQARTGAQIQFPGSRSYPQVGEPENLAELGDVDAANIVKISGPRLACLAALEELKGRIKPAIPELLTATMSVPLKYHHVISEQGAFFRNLRSFGVQVDQSIQPQKSAVPLPPPTSNAETSARIDDAEGGSGEIDMQWQVTQNYQDAEEGDSVWTLKARDQASLERAQKAVSEAIEHAQNMTHVGFLTLADRSVFPRIVGSKGANVARLRAQTGADITVSRENNTIVIIGNESAITSAKDAIMKMVLNRPQRSRYD